MHKLISLPQNSQTYYTYNNVVWNTYSGYDEDACIQILRGNTE